MHFQTDFSRLEELDLLMATEGAVSEEQDFAFTVEGERDYMSDSFRRSTGHCEGTRLLFITLLSARGPHASKQRITIYFKRYKKKNTFKPPLVRGDYIIVTHTLRLRLL